MNYETYLKQLIKQIETSAHPHTRQDSIILARYKMELQRLQTQKQTASK